MVLLDHGTKLDEGSPKEMVDLYKRVLVHQAPGEGKEEQPKAEVQAAERLFAGESQEVRWLSPHEMNPGVLEYGDKRGEMTGFQVLDAQGLPTTTIEKGTEFTMKVRVLYHEEISDPIFAFTIKDMRGTEITGTNTMFERISIPVRKPGETDVVSFTQRADLQGGEYLISFGLTGYREGNLPSTTVCMMCAA